MPPRQDAELATTSARRTLVFEDVEPYTANDIQHIISQFPKLTWDKQVAALTRISATAVCPPSRPLILTHLKVIVPLYTASISSLRSQVASAGLQAIKPLLTALGSRIDSELPNIVPLLLSKLAENSKAFLAGDAAEVLDTIAAVSAPRRLVPLLSQCRDAKSASRQSGIGWLLYRILLAHGSALVQHLPQPLTPKTYATACANLARQGRDGACTPRRTETPRGSLMAPSSASSSSRTPARLRPAPVSSPSLHNIASPSSGLGSCRDMPSWQQRHHCLSIILALLVSLAEDKAADARLWAARSLLCLHALVDSSAAAAGVAPLTQEDDGYSSLEVLMCAALTDTMGTGQIDMGVLAGPGLASGTLRNGSGLASARGSVVSVHGSGLSSARGSVSRNTPTPRISASAPGLRSAASLAPLDGTLTNNVNAGSILRLLTSRDWAEEMASVCAEIPGWAEAQARAAEVVEVEAHTYTAPSTPPRSYRSESEAPSMQQPRGRSSVAMDRKSAMDGSVPVASPSRVKSLDTSTSFVRAATLSTDTVAASRRTRADYGGRAMSLQHSRADDDISSDGCDHDRYPESSNGNRNGDACSAENSDMSDSEDDTEGDGLPNSYMARYRMSLARNVPEASSGMMQIRETQKNPERQETTESQDIPVGGARFDFTRPPTLTITTSVSSNQQAIPAYMPTAPLSANTSTSPSASPSLSPSRSTSARATPIPSTSTTPLSLPLGMGQSRMPVRPALLSAPLTQPAPPMSPRSSLFLQQAALRHEQQHRTHAATHSITHTHTLSPAHAFTPHFFADPSLAPAPAPTHTHAEMDPTPAPAPFTSTSISTTTSPSPALPPSRSLLRTPDSTSSRPRPSPTLALRSLPRPAPPSSSSGSGGVVAPPVFTALAAIAAPSLPTSSSLPPSSSLLAPSSSSLADSHTRTHTPTPTASPSIPAPTSLPTSSSTEAQALVPHPPVTPRNDRMRFLRFRSPRTATPQSLHPHDLPPSTAVNSVDTTLIGDIIGSNAAALTSSPGVSSTPSPPPATGTSTNNAQKAPNTSGHATGMPAGMFTGLGNERLGPNDGKSSGAEARGEASAQPVGISPRDGTISARLRLLRQRPGTGPQELAKHDSIPMTSQDSGKKMTSIGVSLVKNGNTSPTIPMLDFSRVSP